MFGQYNQTIIVMFGITSIIIYLFYCLIISNYINKTIDRYRKIHRMHPKSIAEQFSFQVRPDNPYDWSKLSMILTAIFILPIRIVLFSFSTSMCISCHWIVNKIPQSKFRQVFLRVTMYISCRIMMLSVGYNYINFKTEHPSQYLDDYPKPNDDFVPLPLMVANHVAFTDIFLLSTIYCPSYLAKSELSKICVFSNAVKAMNSLWVYRTDRNSKDILLNSITDRIQQYNESIDCRSNTQIHQSSLYSPLLIFPEGTTSNGHHLLSFKQGAFVNKANMRVVCIDYTNQPYMNFLDNEGQLANLVMLMCQFHNTVTITEFKFNPSYLYQDKTNHDDWKVYADQVKLLIQNKLKIESSESGFMDVKVYTKLYESMFSITVDQAVEQVKQDNLRRQQKHAEKKEKQE